MSGGRAAACYLDGVRPLLLLLTACAPSDLLVAGVVLSDGEPVVAATLDVGGVETVTGPGGRFGVTFPPGTETPLATVFATPDRAVSSWACADAPAAMVLDVSPPSPPPTATLDVALRGLDAADERWWVQVATLGGTDRAPAPIVWDLDLAPPTVVDDDPTRRRARWLVPAAETAAVAVARLAYRPYLGEPRWLVSHLAAFPVRGLQPGEVRPVDLLMTGETLREAWLWDGTGPQGADTVRISQQVTVAGLDLDVLLWDGPNAVPAWLPSVHLQPANPPGRYAGDFRYNRYEDCVVRAVGAPLDLGLGAVPRAWLDGAGHTGDVELERLAVPPPVPDTVSVRVDRDPALTVTWTVLDRADGVLEAELTGPGGTWALAGPMRCAPRAVTWPFEVRADDVVRGEVRWRDGARWGRCVVRRG